MPNRSLLLSALAALPGLLLLASPLRADDIPIGEFASLTGGNATFGQSAHDGTALAIDEINAAGGELGRQLHLITEDDRSTSGEPANIVRKLISSDKVVAILGEVASSKSLEAAPICQASHIPMISPASTNPKVTEVGDYVFRVCFIDPFQGTVMAKFALNTLLAKRVALLTDVKQDYSQGLAQYFKEYFTGHGGQITSEKSYSSGDKDFRAQLTAIKADKPDAIFVPGYYTEVGLIARQARSLGIKAPLLGGDGWDSPELVPVGGSALEGDYFSDHFSTQNGAEVVQNFIKKYQAKYGAMPDAMAALGHDSAMILADAIKRAGTTDGEKLRDAIAATKDYPGVTGSITLDANRNASKPAVILEVKDKVFKYITTVQP
jgi:branched-chain amino acid transport system substrate-binding protein